MHQTEISMGTESYTFSSHLISTGVWGKAPSHWRQGKARRSSQHLANLGNLLPKIIHS